MYTYDVHTTCIYSDVLRSRFNSCSLEAPPPLPPFMLISVWSPNGLGESRCWMDQLTTACCFMLMRVRTNTKLPLSHILWTASRLNNAGAEDARLHVNIGESIWRGGERTLHPAMGGQITRNSFYGKKRRASRGRILSWCIDAVIIKMTGDIIELWMRARAAWSVRAWKT